MIAAEDESKKQIAWQIVIFVAVCYTAIEAPITFFLNLEMGTWHLWMDGIITSIFIIDLYFNYIYYPKLEAIREKEDPYTQFHKFSHSHKWLPVDLLASIPYDLIGALFMRTMGVEAVLQIFRAVRLLRLFRLFKLISIWRNMAVMPKAIKLILFFAFAVMSINGIACVWMWIYPAQAGEDLLSFYIKAIYWAITTLTTIGYGDITPTTNAGRLYTMFVMLTGVGVYGVVIGNVSKMLLEADRHKEASKQKLEDLNMFMKHYRIPRHLQKEVFNFYNHLLNKRMSDNDNTIIGDLPSALQADLKIYMNIKLISNVPVFSDCNLSCLKMVASSLEQIYFSPKELIIEKGEKGDEMYIIGHGIVEVLGPEGQTLAALKDGMCFGEAALLRQTVRSADVRSVGYCDVYKLNKENFLKIVDRHPTLKDNFEKIMNNRSNNNKTPKKVAS